MLISIHPKLPMTNRQETLQFYTKLGFAIGGDYGDYLILKMDDVELHLFEFKEINPLDNYGMVYIRTTDIESFYVRVQDNGIAIHPNGGLEHKPWGQMEFSILDPCHNLLTFGGEK